MFKQYLFSVLLVVVTLQQLTASSLNIIENNFFGNTREVIDNGSTLAIVEKDGLYDIDYEDYKSDGVESFSPVDPSILMLNRLTNCDVLDTEVWPGDVNNNGEVNYEDVLFICLKNGKSGLARLNATTDWEAQLALDWEDTTIDNVDAKYADCDGNGLVDIFTDVSVIANNYGQTTPEHLDSPDEPMLTQGYVLVAERRDIENFDGTTTVIFDLKLKNYTNQPLKMAGLGFSAIYENGVAPRLDSEASELGINDDNLFTFFQTHSTNRIDGVISRKDRQNRTLAANDSMIISNFIIDEDIVTLGSEDSTNNSILLNLDNITLVNAQGASYRIGGSTATSNSGDQAVSTLSIALTATHALECPTGGTANIIPFGGVPPYQFLWEDGQTTATVEALNPGTYYVTLSDAVAEQVKGFIAVEGTVDCMTALATNSSYFEAIPQSSSILLAWTTNPQNNIQKIEIERSIDGKIFNTIGHQVTYEQTHQYKFEDHNIQAQQTYYYRLKMIEGRQIVFSTITSAKLTNLFFGVQCFPNPVVNKLTIMSKQVLSKNTEIVVSDAYGQKIQRLLFPKDLSQFVLNFEAFSSGLYFVTIQSDGEAASFRVVK